MLRTTSILSLALLAAFPAQAQSTRRFVYSSCSCEQEMTLECPDTTYQFPWPTNNVCENFLEPEKPKVTFYMRFNELEPVIDMSCTVFTGPNCTGESFTVGRAANETFECWESPIGGTLSAVCEWEQIQSRCETETCIRFPNTSYCAECQ